MKTLTVVLFLCFTFKAFSVELIPPGSEWRYYDKTEKISEQWFTSAYEDKDWSTGLGQFGYGEGDESTVTSFGDDPENKPLAQYFRRTFFVQDINLLKEVKLRLLVDDGALVYLNDKEVHRINLSDKEPTPLKAVNSLIEFVWVQVPLEKSLFKAGENTISVAVYQISASSTDLSFDLALVSVDK